MHKHIKKKYRKHAYSIHIIFYVTHKNKSYIFLIDQFKMT